MEGEEQNNSQKECHICGFEITEDTDYCPECGADFKNRTKYNY